MFSPPARDFPGDADVAKLQNEDEVLGPVKAMLSQGYSPTLDDLRALPLYGRKL